MRPHHAALAFLGLLALGLASDQLRASAHERYRSAQRYEDIYYLPPPEWLPALSLGWDEAAADLLWMRALIYFGEEFRHAGGVNHVFDYGEAIVALDPHFLAAYRWMGMAALYRPQAITTDDVERAVAFMQRGAELFPDDGELQWNIGAALAFELPGMLDDAEGIRQARERGIPHLTRAAQLGAAPDWAPLSNATLLLQIGRRAQAIQHLAQMLEVVEDPEARAELEARIEALRSAPE